MLYTTYELLPHIQPRGSQTKYLPLKERYASFLDGLIFFNDAESKNKKMSSYSIENRRVHTGQTCLVSIHAYCLLPNHFHLLVSCESPKQLSKFMQKLGTGYVGYFNEMYSEHSGTIFQGRYKKVLVENEAQLYQLVAYINGNGYIHNIDPPATYLEYE